MKRKKQTTKADHELLSALDVELEDKEAPEFTAREQRVLSGFSEIETFARQRRHSPQHGEEREIFERMYAARLDCIRESEECLSLLKDRDTLGLLSEGDASSIPDEELLGLLDAGEESISQLTHVRPVSVRAAETIAQQEPCRDFEKFAPLFEAVQQELDSGERTTAPFRDHAAVAKGDWFILEGQKLFVAKRGSREINDYGRPDTRLRVIFENGTESNLLLRSLQRALNKDKTSRRIGSRDLGPLFEGNIEEGHVKTGCVYVLRSLSDHPYIQENRDLVHKIGVTRNKVGERTSGASNSSTFLNAKVEEVARFETVNLSPQKLEEMLHRFFHSVRLDLLLTGDNEDHHPREWFLVPLSEIEKVIDLICRGRINDYMYDAASASTVPR